MQSLLQTASPHDLSPPLPFSMTLEWSLSSSLPNPKICRRVEEHLKTGWAAPGAKLSARTGFLFMFREISLSRRSKLSWKILHSRYVRTNWSMQTELTAEKDNYFYLCWKGKSEIAKQVNIALWKGMKQSAKPTPLKRDYYFGFSKKLHKNKGQGADKMKIKAVNFGKY